MNRVCLYQRISTDEDHQPTSLKTQRERLERYCEAMEDWRVVAAFEDQASGTSLDRPGLQQALELAREQRFDLLLVYRVDRLSRKVRQLAGLCEELDQLDIVLKSATEPFDTGSPAGRMMLQMLGVFAEFEHATIVDRVTAGLERRVREGKWMSGRTPYGYTRHPQSKLLIPDQVKAPVVRRIFRLYAEGKLGTTAIARTLDSEGAPPPRKQGWSPNALQLILANPAYKGLVRWNNELHPGLHEPLIDQETFEAAQQILKRRAEDASLRRGNPSDFLLSGLVRCHHCGRAYVGTSAHGRKGRYTYYACSTRYKYGPSKCNGDRLPKEALESAVLEQLAHLYRDGHVVEKALADAAAVTQSERPRLEDQLASARGEITRLEGRLDRYFEAFEQGSLSAADCQDRVRGHRARLETLREQEADLIHQLGTRAHTPPDTAALAGLADQLDEIIGSESPEQAKELLRLLVKEIRVHNRRRIIPTYRVPAAVRAIPSKVGGTGLEPVPPACRAGAPIATASDSSLLWLTEADRRTYRSPSPQPRCATCVRLLCAAKTDTGVSSMLARSTAVAAPVHICGVERDTEIKRPAQSADGLLFIDCAPANW
jgi:site-specific DNA recombinase